MNFNSLIKKLGIKDLLFVTVLGLSLVVFLDKFYNYFMINPFLGRVLNIIIIILWTCINKYLGVAYVIILVFFLMSNNNKFIENFETEKVEEKTDKSEDSKEKKINVVTDASVETTKKDKTISVMEPTESSNEINENTVISKSNETKNMATEGFDLLSTENTIKRGKQSNSIPVDQIMAQASNDNISPYEETEFSEGFAIL